MAHEDKKSTTPLSSNIFTERNTLSYNDFDISFRHHPMSGDLIEKSNEESIRQSLYNLMQLNRFEKPFHPEISGRIRELLFEPFETNPDYYEREFTDRITKLIKKHEPRVELNHVKVRALKDSYSIGIDINYTVVGKPIKATNSFVLERLR